MDDATRAALLAELRAQRQAVEAANQALSQQRAREFAGEVETRVARERTPLSDAATLADALIPAIDARIRERWTSMSWVRHTMRGRVLSVDTSSRTCKVSLPLDGSPAMGGVDPSAERPVRYGMGVPSVGKTYAVHFPVRLPDEPTALLTGPVPAGLPWLKATGGDTYLYWGSPLSSSLTAVYRVLVPPQTLPGEAWEIAADHPAFAFNAARNKERVFAGPLYTTDTLEFVAISGGTNTTNLGTNMSTTTADDAVLAVVTTLTPFVPYSGGPTWARQTAVLRLTWRGNTYTPYSNVLLLNQLKIPDTNTASGFLPVPHNYFRDEVFSAAGWDAGANTSLGQEGQFTAVWALGCLPPLADPVPVGGDGGQDDYFLWRVAAWPGQLRRLRLVVSVDGASASDTEIGQPSGHCWEAYIRQAADGTFIGYGVWSATLFTDQVPTSTPGVFLTRFRNSPRQVWVGRSESGGAWDWTLAGINADSMVAVNNDGRVAIAEQYNIDDGSGVGLAHVTARYITRDSGATWGAMTPLDMTNIHPAVVSREPLAANLVDVP